MKVNDVILMVIIVDIILWLCKESGEIDLMFFFVRDYNKVGFIFYEFFFDVLILSVVNVGDMKLVYEI